MSERTPFFESRESSREGPVESGAAVRAFQNGERPPADPHERLTWARRVLNDLLKHAVED